MLYFGVRAIENTLKIKNEGVKKSLEKSKNVLEEKRKKSQAKRLHEDQHVYNNCYEFPVKTALHTMKLSPKNSFW